MMVATGLPRTPARVLVCLLTSESDGLPAAELAADLRVSPASISKAVLYLEQLRLIKRERDVHRRRERYLIDDDIWYQASTREVQVCAAWASSANHGAELLGDTPAGNRLAEMSRYFHHVGQDLARSARHWHHTLTSQRTHAGHEQGAPDRDETG
ncbi:GbsR/MarR family transcriptional regulator [Pseudonocardia spinosispora]|uniref:GbsR/MarR family transcriptional regulator n=1 Tax=Pseudonocardia spinosispora TaxID=103441 RepID=UPI003CCBC7A5